MHIQRRSWIHVPITTSESQWVVCCGMFAQFSVCVGGGGGVFNRKLFCKWRTSSWLKRCVENGQSDRKSSVTLYNCGEQKGSQKPWAEDQVAFHFRSEPGTDLVCTGCTQALWNYTRVGFSSLYGCHDFTEMIGWLDNRMNMNQCLYSGGWWLFIIWIQASFKLYSICAVILP